MRFALRSLRFSLCALRSFPLLYRQTDTEGRTLADFTVHLDTSPVVLNNHVTDRKAQSGPLAVRFGRKKWIEDLVQMFLGNTMARIGEFHRNEVFARAVLVRPAPDCQRP